jgi:hypothetical protein
VQGQPGRPGAAIEPRGQSCRQATGSHLPWSRHWSNGIRGVFVCAVPSPSAADDMLRRLPISKPRAPFVDVLVRALRWHRPGYHAGL